MYVEDYANQEECSECGYLLDPRFDKVWFLYDEPLCEDCYMEYKAKQFESK